MMRDMILVCTELLLLWLADSCHCSYLYRLWDPDRECHFTTAAPTEVGQRMDRIQNKAVRPCFYTVQRWGLTPRTPFTCDVLFVLPVVTFQSVKLIYMTVYDKRVSIFLLKHALAVPIQAWSQKPVCEDTLQLESMWSSNCLTAPSRAWVTANTEPGRQMHVSDTSE